MLDNHNPVRYSTFLIFKLWQHASIQRHSILIKYSVVIIIIIIKLVGVAYAHSYSCRLPAFYLIMILKSNLFGHLYSGHIFKYVNLHHASIIRLQK